MALAKERGTQDSHMALTQAFSLYGNVYGGGSSVQVPDSSSLGLFNHHETVIEEGESSDFINGNGSVKNFSVVSRLPYISTPSNGFVFGASNSPPEEALSVINFKAGYDHLGCPVESLLSFEQGERLSYNSYNHEDDHSNWADFMDKNNQWNQLNPECGTDSRLSEDLNCLEMASDYGMMNTAANIDENGEERMGWSYSGAADASRSVQQFGGKVACSHKRPYMGDDDKQALKKRGAGTPRKPKPKSVPSKDPQSMAAKNRRERISERLKKLQDLVPNGAKVDLVTMLEKAISYVKFLQLQVKVLATDELWPSPSGKTPEVAQVKEVIDAILSSHRDRISNSK